MVFSREATLGLALSVRPFVTLVYQESQRVTKSHQESPRVTKSHQESPRITKNHQESPRVTKSHQESSRVIKHYKRVKTSRASQLIQVERSNALINFSVLYQALFKRFSSVLCFATSKRQALVDKLFKLSSKRKLLFSVRLCEMQASPVSLPP